MFHSVACLCWLQKTNTNNSEEILQLKLLNGILEVSCCLSLKHVAVKTVPSLAFLMGRKKVFLLASRTERETEWDGKLSMQLS